MELLSISVKIILLTTIIIDSGFLIFIFLKRKRGLIYYLLMIHILGILGWAISILLILQYINVFAAKLTFVFAIILAVAKFWFIKVFPENTFPKQIINYWSLLPAFFILIVSFLDGALFREIKVVDGYYINVTNGTYSMPYFIIITYFLIYPLFILFQKYRKGKYNAVIKNQLKYLFAGMTLFFITGLLTNYILPVFFNVYFF